MHCNEMFLLFSMNKIRIVMFRRTQEGGKLNTRIRQENLSGNPQFKILNSDNVKGVQKKTIKSPKGRKEKNMMKE